MSLFKTNVFVICFIYFSFIFAEEIDLPEDVIPKLYEKYKDVIQNDNETVSTRRIFSNDKEYQLHVEKLKAVNGFKKHNIMIRKKNIKRNGDKDEIFYINNPVETKIPNAFLTLEDFKTFLTDKAKERKQIFKDVVQKNVQNIPPSNHNVKNKPQNLKTIKRVTISNFYTHNAHITKTLDKRITLQEEIDNKIITTVEEESVKDTGISTDATKVENVKKDETTVEDISRSSYPLKYRNYAKISILNNYKNVVNQKTNYPTSTQATETTIISDIPKIMTENTELTDTTIQNVETSTDNTDNTPENTETPINITDATLENTESPSELTDTTSENPETSTDLDEKFDEATQPEEQSSDPREQHRPWGRSGRTRPETETETTTTTTRRTKLSRPLVFMGGDFNQNRRVLE